MDVTAAEHRGIKLGTFARGGKLGAFASMVPMLEAQLERSLEDVTGPIDPQQVQKPPAPRIALVPASNCLDLGPRCRTLFWSKLAAARPEG